MKNQYEIDYQQGYDNANDEWLERIDKIRAEIMELDYDDYDGYEGAHISPMVCRDLVIEIIDKYRKEQTDERKV